MDINEYHICAYSYFYRFYIFVTSGYLLINRNTYILKNDYMQLRYINEDVEDYFSDFDKNVISDVNNYFQLMLRNGENSKALQPIVKKELKTVLLHYGTEFSRALNAIYGNEERQFRLAQVVQLKNSFIATVFKSL